MKIFYTANIRIPTEKAHGYMIARMCSAYADAGHDVILVVPRRLNNLHEDVFCYYSLPKNFKIISLPTLDTIEFGKIGYWIQTISFNFFVFFYVLYHKIFSKINLIYSRDEFTLYLLSLLPWGNTHMMWESHVPKNNFIVRQVVKNVSKVVTITHGLMNYYMRVYRLQPEKFVIAPSGVDVTLFTVDQSKDEIRNVLHLPTDKKIIEYVGAYKTMGKSKGVDELIDVFARLVENQKDLFLLLVGLHAWEQGIVQSHLQKLGLNETQYRLIGHIGRNHIPQYLALADVLVMNYPNTEHYGHYMSPVKMFEYMTSGVPIVTTDLPSIREVLNDTNAIVVSGGDLKSGIEKVFSDPELVRSLASQARIDVQQYSWEERVQKILA